jgi:DNA-binding transcriptional MerR regulator
MQTRYPIRAVAKITGLSLDTLRAWERRYQAVVPERSDRGRQYGPAQIDRLLLLNRLVQKGHSIGGIAPLTDQALKDLLAEAPAEIIPSPATTDLCAPILSALEDFDASGAGDELNRLAAALAPRDLVYQVVLPLMQEVGVRWHDGKIAIAQEHLVSQILRNLLGGMIRLLRPSKPAMRMLLATPAGESHEFGILASAMIASINGIEPVYLGPDLPASEIAKAAERVSARAIVLGITVFHENTAQEVTPIASAMPESAELWVGGAGSGDLDLSGLSRKTVALKDLSEFEAECESWSNTP